MTLPVRPARDSDMAFIIDSWRRYYIDGRDSRDKAKRCDGAVAVRGADRDHLFQQMTTAIKYLCRTGSALVAHNPDDEDHIVGFVAYSGRTFHFAAIKADFEDALTVEHMLRGVELDSYTFRCPYLERLLDGFRGAHFEELKTGSGSSIHRWHPPKGWRFTPRI